MMPLPWKREQQSVLHVCKFVAGNCLLTVLLCCALNSSTAEGTKPSPERELSFHSNIPLGAEGFLLKPSDRAFYLFATAQNARFEGMHQARVAGQRVLLDAQGRQVEHYPETVTFRVTASAWSEKLIGVALFPVKAAEDTNDYLLNLRFRVLIFHGLQVTTIEPAKVELIGMPADVPYQERIYNLTFEVGHVPVEDRAVLEVLSPDGERLCKFHLDLL